jgi:hypothetical protein
VVSRQNDLETESLLANCIPLVKSVTLLELQTGADDLAASVLFWLKAITIGLSQRKKIGSTT